MRGSCVGAAPELTASRMNGVRGPRPATAYSDYYRGFVIEIGGWYVGTGNRAKVVVITVSLARDVTGEPPVPIGGCHPGNSNVMEYVRWDAFLDYIFLWHFLVDV